MSFKGERDTIDSSRTCSNGNVQTWETYQTNDAYGSVITQPFRHRQVETTWSLDSMHTAISNQGDECILRDHYPPFHQLPHVLQFRVEGVLFGRSRAFQIRPYDSFYPSVHVRHIVLMKLIR